MSEETLHEQFGVTAEELEKRAAEYEQDDWSDMQFGTTIVGRPVICDDAMQTIAVKVPRSRIEAMKRVQEERGITRSEFVRAAIDHELVELS